MRRVTLLFTTFPVATETFLQREVTALRALGVEVEPRSLWGGAAGWGGKPVVRLGLGGIARSFAAAALWAVRSPRGLARAVRLAVHVPFRGWVNFWETWLGLAAGLTWARELSEPVAGEIHAVWGSAPATAALVIKHLTGRPFSFAAHAYDLFENGGDGLLPEKVRAGTWMRSSTEVGCQALMGAGANPKHVHLVRRGLPELPPRRSLRARSGRLELFAVGRLVPKMGFDRLLDACAILRAEKVPFRLRLVGGGPLEGALRAQVRALGLTDAVTLLGARPFAEVAELFGEVDALVFSGVVSRSGDRAGLPNVIAEAMVFGVPVVATPIGAVEEAIADGQTGLIARDASGIAVAVRQLWADPARAIRLADHARTWAETHYDARRNMARLAALLFAAERTVSGLGDFPLASDEERAPNRRQDGPGPAAP